MGGGRNGRQAEDEEEELETDLFPSPPCSHSSFSTRPPEAADTSLSSSTNSPSRPDYSPNKVQRRSPSHQSPQTDYNPNQNQNQPQPQPPQQQQQQLPPPPPPPPTHQQHNSFPFHSFEQPAPPPLTNSFFSQPSGHPRESSSSSSASQHLASSSSNGNGAMDSSILPQWSHEGMDSEFDLSHSLELRNESRSSRAILTFLPSSVQVLTLLLNPTTLATSLHPSPSSLRHTTRTTTSPPAPPPTLTSLPSLRLSKSPPLTLVAPQKLNSTPPSTTVGSLDPPILPRPTPALTSLIPTRLRLPHTVPSQEGCRCRATSQLCNLSLFDSLDHPT